jgi:Domain of unknown function (DUF4342)
MMTGPNANTIIPEEIRVRGSQLVEKVTELIAAGNIRRIIVKHDGRTIVEIPLTIGVIGTLLVPQVAALGAIAALITECTIEVIRTNVPANIT